MRRSLLPALKQVLCRCIGDGFGAQVPEALPQSSAELKQQRLANKAFLFASAKRAFEELERMRGNPADLELPEQTLVLIVRVQGIIDKGGFRLLFENNFPFCPPYSFFSAAYRRIGAIDAAICIDRAAFLFPFERPQEFKEMRNSFVDSLEDSHQIFELGNQVSGDERIWSKLEDYVRLNPIKLRDENADGYSRQPAEK